MRLIKKVDVASRIVARVRKRGKVIGLVPTMGYLHEGHLSLVRIARKKCGYLIVSIFVNPTQFGPKEDFRQYPRDLKKDLSMLRKEGVDLVFNPSVREMYGPDHQTYVEVVDWSRLLCGASRPIHFRGVTTVVLKFFNILQPDIAVFGRKDYQQAAIIRKMVRELNLKVNVITGPVVREKDGLAMSSRNIYLNPGQRQNAVVISESLEWVRQAYKKGARQTKEVRTRMARMIRNRGGRIDYIAVVDKDTLEPVKKLKKGTLVALAVFFGRTRLIDNTVL
ncbi:MAG: pantoate--beta-alanine ligase [candidate division WOR-3 bacterium]|nr:MAG: pantoate--beta-alanine ligase [candidate division WOR-3 bacterium]